MEWELARLVPNVSLGILGAQKVHLAGHGRKVFGLFPGLLRFEYPVGETPQLSTTFINQFMKVGVIFPLTSARSGGFIPLTSIGGVRW